MGPPFLRLPLFEGPLDLLLHLCRRQELSVLEMPVSEVTEQFLIYLDVLEELQIDVAGEFLEMASLLCLIKSRELLPAPDLPEEPDDDVPDPRAALIARLLDYKRYQVASEELSARPRLHRDFFVRGQGPLVGGEDRIDAPLAVDLTDLLGALRDLLERRRARAEVHEVGGASYVRLEDRMGAILAVLARGEAPFAALFEADRGRAMIVATFLAILELARRGLAVLSQEGPLQRLRVRPTFSGPPPALDGVGG